MRHFLLACILLISNPVSADTPRGRAQLLADAITAQEPLVVVRNDGLSDYDMDLLAAKHQTLENLEATYTLIMRLNMSAFTVRQVYRSDARTPLPIESRLFIGAGAPAPAVTVLVSLTDGKQTGTAFDSIAYPPNFNYLADRSEWLVVLSSLEYPSDLTQYGVAASSTPKPTTLNPKGPVPTFRLEQVSYPIYGIKDRRLGFKIVDVLPSATNGAPHITRGELEDLRLIGQNRTLVRGIDPAVLKTAMGKDILQILLDSLGTPAPR